MDLLGLRCSFWLCVVDFVVFFRDLVFGLVLAQPDWTVVHLAHSLVSRCFRVFPSDIMRLVYEFF